MLALPAEPRRIWIARVRDGRVVEGGEWLAEDAAAVTQAWREMAGQPSAAPMLWGGIAHGSLDDSPPPRPLEWLDIADAVGADSLLQPLRPARLWLAAGLGLVSAVVAASRLLP